MIAEVSERIDNAHYMIIADYTGMDMPQPLRSRIHYARVVLNLVL